MPRRLIGNTRSPRAGWGCSSGLTRLAHGDAPASRLEELVAERLLEFTHLGADGLDRHVQPLGRAGEAPLPW